MDTLQPGQNRPLTCNPIIVRVSGEPTDAFTRNIRAGAFLLAANGHSQDPTNFIAEDNPRSRDGAITFDVGGREFRINLNAVAPPLERIVLALTIPSGLGPGITFGTFAAIKLLLADPAGKPLLEFAPPLASRAETALILAEIYRHKDQWKVRAVGQGFAAGLPALATHFGVTVREPDIDCAPPSGPGAESGRLPGVSFSGTGFCVSADGYFLTNHHVIQGAVQVQARSPRGCYPLQPVFSDPLNDLALLKTSTAPPEVAAFRSGVQARLGESVIVIGYPLSGLLGSSPQVTTGNVSSLIGLGDDTRALQFTAPVQSGNSGGPLLDADGAVIGMVCAKLNAAWVQQLTGDIPQNVNFAIKSALVCSFLEAVGINYGSRTVGLTRSPAEIAAEAQGFVVRIECRA